MHINTTHHVTKVWPINWIYTSYLLTFWCFFPYNLCLYIWLVQVIVKISSAFLSTPPYARNMFLFGLMYCWPECMKTTFAMCSGASVQVATKTAIDQSYQLLKIKFKVCKNISRFYVIIHKIPSVAAQTNHSQSTTLMCSSPPEKDPIAI